MKKLISFFLLFLVSVSSFNAQNRARFKYKLKQKHLDNRDWVMKDANSNIQKIAGKKALSCLLKLDKTNVSVDFWRILHNGNTIIDHYDGYKQYINNKTPSSGLILTDGRTQIGEPTKVLFIPYNTLSFGLTTIPFRVRPKTKINETENVPLSLSSPKPDLSFNIGYTWGYCSITSRSMNHYGVTLGGFLGVASADLKDGTVRGDSELYGTKKTQTNPAITYGLSMILNRNNLGVIIAIGSDNCFGGYSEDWVYQKSVWFGLGINASLAFF